MTRCAIGSKVYLGDEVDGVTGVRDTSGAFHRWHEEITLDPDGTEECVLIKYLPTFASGNYSQIPFHNVLWISSARFYHNFSEIH